jgi:hypothetical protein
LLLRLTASEARPVSPLLKSRTRVRWLAPLKLCSVAALTAFGPLSAAAQAQSRNPAALVVSDVLKVARPAGGEWMGLYLLNKKVGYGFEKLEIDPSDASRAVLTKIECLRTTVGGHKVERRAVERRTYEAKPQGRLVSLTVEMTGDGGDQSIQGTATADGLHVTIRRPGHANVVKTLPPTLETVEDADQARLAVLRQGSLKGTIIDGLDLAAYGVASTFEAMEMRVVGGARVRVAHVRTLNEKDHIALDEYFTPSGATAEVDLGSTMKEVPEPESTATRFDEVEVFTLTGVALPHALPADVRKVPNSVTFVLAGLPKAFEKNDYRQSFKTLEAGGVRLTVTAAPPIHKEIVAFPLADPEGGENLKDSLAMELDNSEVQATARKAVGAEKDAYGAAKRVAAWVGSHMVNDYGASSDRASDALRAMRGDCTEHSLLTVAMLRSVGIPARRIDGLIYVVAEGGLPRLYWHEWVEAFVGQWTQLDPTWNEPVADAAHIALGKEAREEILPLMGQIKVLDAR